MSDPESLELVEIKPLQMRGPRCCSAPPDADIFSVVIGIHGKRFSDLAEIVGARRLLNSLFRLVQRGQKHPGQNGNDRDHYYYNLLNIHYGV